MLMMAIYAFLPLAYKQRLELKLHLHVVQNFLFLENVPFLIFLVAKKLILKVVNSVVSNSYFLLWSYMKYVKKCIIYRSEMRI